MRTKSNELMKNICEFAEQFYLKNRRSPSITEISNELGIARGTTHKYLVYMNEIKMISYTSKKIITDVIRKADLATTQANIIGTIACGAPVLAEENIQEYISLPSVIFGNGDLYILNASGDSMIDAGIDDGDLVVIKKQTTAEDGDIVVALVNNENTLKRFYIDKKKKRYILHPENSKLKDIIVSEVQIQGVAQHVIKAL